MKKPPSTQAQKKEPFDLGLFICSFLVLMAVFVGLGFTTLNSFAIRREVAETNSLLATFQRTETVKQDCGEGYIFSDGECYRTIGKARQLSHCEQMENLCKDGIVGPQCDVKCTPDEGEGLE